MRYKILIVLCLLYSLHIKAITYEKLFENDQVGVSIVQIMSKERVSKHYDKNPHIVIAVDNDVVITRYEADGAITKVDFPKDKAVFRQAETEDKMHESSNEELEPAKLIIIELKSKDFLNTKKSKIKNSNKIIYLISPPRSLSVAFLRMMEARGDFKVMHEISQKAYDLINYSELTKEWFRQDAPATFEDVKNMVLEQANISNVFIKEMSFAVKDFLFDDKELILDPRVQFVFLIRNPHHNVISFYKKTLSSPDCSDIPNNFSRLIGYKCTYELLQLIKKFSPNKPIIITTEALYNNPREIIQKFCSHVGIEFKESSLQWKDLGENFCGYEEWNETKYPKYSNHWHGEAMRSVGFSKPSNYACDANGRPTFIEISNIDHRKVCIDAYEENMQYYNLLLSEDNVRILH